MEPDWELLKTWGIEKDLQLDKICDALEEKQLDLIQMRRDETDSEKQSEISAEVKKMECQFKLITKEIKEQAKRREIIRRNAAAQKKTVTVPVVKNDPVTVSKHNNSPIPSNDYEFKAKIDKSHNETTKKVKNTVSKECDIKIADVLSAVLLAFGFLYLLGGIHPGEWSNNSLLSFMPDAFPGLIIPFHLFWLLILPNLTINAKFGIEVITLAYSLRSLCEARRKTELNKAFYYSVKVIMATIIIWHLILMIIEKQSFVADVIYLAVALLVCRIFGFIIGNLANGIVNKKSVSGKIILTIIVLVILIIINKHTANFHPEWISWFYQKA